MGRSNLATAGALSSGEPDLLSQVGVDNAIAQAHAFSRPRKVLLMPVVFAFTSICLLGTNLLVSLSHQCLRL